MKISFAVHRSFDLHVRLDIDQSCMFYVRNYNFKRLLWMKGYDLITDQNIIGIQEYYPINADFVEIHELVLRCYKDETPSYSIDRPSKPNTQNLDRTWEELDSFIEYIKEMKGG